MRDYLFILLIAAAVTYLLTPLVRRFAQRINAQHAPRARDVHKEPTPLIGGLAMYGGMVAALLVAERLTYLQQAFPSSKTVNRLLVAGGLLVIIGIIDDRYGMSPLQKAAGQVAAGGILALAGLHVKGDGCPGQRLLALVGVSSPSSHSGLCCAVAVAAEPSTPAVADERHDFKAQAGPGCQEAKL